VRRYYETRVSRCPTHFLLPLPEHGCFAVCWYYIIRSHVSVLFRKGVRVVRDDDQDSTDLMKCIQSLQDKEKADGVDVGGLLLPLHPIASDPGIYVSPLPLRYQYVLFLSDSLRRRLIGWLLWATRSDRPLIIISTQAPEKRTPTIRRRGRERRLGPR
jgi:hypothetical protein